jgi:hypothetical protein
MAYLDDLKKTLDTTIEMRDRLKFRIESLNEKCKNTRDHDDYDVNEFRITIIKTQGEIDVLDKIIKEKTEYFENYAKEYEFDLAETEKYYDRLIEKAKTLKDKSPALQHALGSVKWDVQKESEEARVFFYKRLKDIINKM